MLAASNTNKQQLKEDSRKVRASGPTDVNTGMPLVRYR